MNNAFVSLLTCNFFFYDTGHFEDDKIFTVFAVASQIFKWSAAVSPGVER